jgi:hypothetical protein
MSANYCLVKMQSKEKADCTVLATQFCLGLSYAEAHKLMADLGRKPGCRFSYRFASGKLGLETRDELSCMTVGKALDSMQSGRFVVRVAHHVFAVVDGRIYDNGFTNPRSRVKMVYEANLNDPGFLRRYPYLEKIVAQVIHLEQNARNVLLRDAPAVIEDKIWRAYGLLRYARSLSFEEVMNLLSGVRLGLSMNILNGLRVYTLNKIMIYAQTAHLEQAAALAPGLSRSGLTLSVALFLGLQRANAARFVFLMSLPAVAAVAVKEVLDLSRVGMAGIPVTMGGDGVSQIVSRRLPRHEPAALSA